MKRYILIAILLVLAQSAFAVPASRKPYRYTQPDGTVLTLTNHGDEFFHWTTDASGRTLEMDADGFYRPISANVIKARRAKAIERRAKANRRRVHKISSANTGERRFLVILVEFADLKFKVQNPQSAFNDQMNQTGYSAGGATGSVKDYYVDNSMGKFTPIFDVYGPVAVSKNYSYYGKDSDGIEGNDYAPEVAFAEACKKLDGQIDFSKYDSDGDGEVDVVFFYYAGFNQAEGAPANTIWPHEWEMEGSSSLSDSDRRFDGKYVNTYSCTSELSGTSGSTMAGIGTACHEFGHALGLPDLYDTDYETNGSTSAVSFFSVMDSGSYANDGRTPPYFGSVERYMMGWMDFPEQLVYSGNYTLVPIQNNFAYYTPTTTEGEYFVYECRTGTGWDRYIPSGMVVFHYDRSSRIVKIPAEIDDYGNVTKYESVTAASLWDEWEATNSINENGSHPCYYTVCAGDQSNRDLEFYFDSYMSDLANVPFPNSGSTTSYTPKDWAGKTTGYSFSKIAFASSGVTFTLAGQSLPTFAVSGKVKDAEGAAIAGAAVTLSQGDALFGAETSSDGSWEVDLGTLSGEFTLEVEADGYQPYSAALTVSEAATVVEDIVLKAIPSSIPDLGFTYIYAPKRSFSAGDEFEFVLATPSGVKASKIVWVFDGMVKSASSVTLTSGKHTVEARVTYSDGKTETIEWVVRAE